MRMAAPLALVLAAATVGCAASRATATTPRVKAEEIVERSAPPPAVAAPAPEETEPDAAGESSDGIVHVVQPGQTLWRIARAYDVPLDALMEANGIDDPTHVEVGTPIFVPGARATIDVAPYPSPVPGLHFRPEPSADFVWPVAGGEFMRPFGEPRRHHRHAGIDIRGAKGQEILAARAGTVAFCGGTHGGYGTMVVLDHGDGVQTLYAHAQKVLVKTGDSVSRGQPIALVGRTGNATTEHCHFELRLENRAVDPIPYLTATTEARR